MTYAHTTAGVVDQIGSPPALCFDGTRWWDLRPRDPAILASFGWLPLVEVARPADTAGTTWDRGYIIAADAVTVTWTERAKTADELASDAATAARIADRAAVRAILDAINLQVIDAAQTQKAAAQAILDATAPTNVAGLWVKIKDAARVIRDSDDALIEAGRSIKSLARYVKDL